MLDTRICKNHPGAPSQDVSWMCITCNRQSVCIKCIKENMHSGHDIEGIKEEITRRIRKLHNLVGQIDARQERIQQKLLKQLKANESHSEKVIADLKAKVIEYLDTILLKEAKLRHDRYVGELQLRADKISKQLSALKGKIAAEIEVSIKLLDSGKSLGRAELMKDKIFEFAYNDLIQQNSHCKPKKQTEVLPSQLTPISNKIKEELTKLSVEIFSSQTVQETSIQKIDAITKCNSVYSFAKKQRVL